MRNNYILIVLLAIMGRNVAAESTDLASARQYYKNVFMVEHGDAYAMMRFYDGINAGRDSISNHISTVITLNDREINEYLIGYLFWRVAPYAAAIHNKAPGQDQLDDIRLINGLKQYLLSYLYSVRPHIKTFDVVAILYKDDDEAKEALMSLGKNNDYSIGNVINACIMAGIYDDAADILAMTAMSSDSSILSSIASRYLMRRPLPAALPLIVEQLRRPDPKVNFTMAGQMADHFYIEPDILENISMSDLEAHPGKYIDSWRSELVSALLAYNDSDLAVYSDAICGIKDEIILGPSSAAQYGLLTNRIISEGSLSKEAH